MIMILLTLNDIVWYKGLLLTSPSNFQSDFSEVSEGDSRQDPYPRGTDFRVKLLLKLNRIRREYNNSASEVKLNISMEIKLLNCYGMCQKLQVI